MARSTVLGAGVSNTPLIKYLLDRGDEVTVRDKAPFEKLNDTVRSYEGKVKFILGEGYLDGIEADFIFRSPGIRLDAGSIPEAVGKGAALTSEMEEFFSLCPCRIIGVTGSDGKTTTTTLISEMLSARFGKEKVFVGGNIGEPLLPRLGLMTPDCFAVVELSSFQLMTMKKCPDIAVITNVAPNHLDYHKGMDEYVLAKSNIFRRMKAGNRIVLNTSNKITASMMNEVPEGVEKLGFEGSGTLVENGFICREGEQFLDPGDIFIPGHHNVENYEGVIAAIGDIVGKDVVQSVAKSFKGVPHRIEFIRELDGVKFYNSSIDSSPTRTAAALRSFAQKTVVICGGYDKHIPFAPLADVLCEKAKAVVLTGATADKILDALIACGKPLPPIVRKSDFTDAVNAARSLASEGDTVILSPACASFDAFKNFEVRGDFFRSIVNSWEEK